MQAALVLLAVAGSTAWLALDASKRDWADNSFAKNVPTWVVGSLLVWPLIFPMYVFAHRKKAPLKASPAPKPTPEPAVAMAAAGPSEQYGPSVDEVEQIEKTEEVEMVEEPAPEPVVESAVPVAEIEREPVVEFVAPEPAPVVEFVAPERAPVVETAASEPVVAIELEPDPVVELELETAEPVAEVTPEPVAFEPAPEPAAAIGEPVVEPEPELEPEPVAEPEPAPVLEISYPDVEQAPPGLSVDAFKDIKPVSFGGIVVEQNEPEAPAEPEPAPAVEPEPVFEPEPVAAFEPEPPPVVEPEPAPYEPLSYPVEDEPVIEPVAEPAEEPAIAAAVAEPVAADEPKAKKRGLRMPNPELKLPSFGKKKEPKVKAASKRPSLGLKLPQITLPPNLEGPLSDLERKIALGSVVAIVAAAALGYATAPSDEAPTSTPAPAAAAESR